MRGSLAVLAVAMGCGSNWNIRKGEELVVGCPTERYYFVDADQDGWGDPGIERQLLCEPEEGVTATNGLDCDDADAAITGQVGTACPAGLVTSEPGAPPPRAAGLAVGDSEFAFLYGATTPTVEPDAAESACAQWSTSTFDGQTWTADGGLATFGTTDELTQFKGQLSAAAGDALWAGYVGIHWEGDLTSGVWSWVDDSPDTLITDSLGWCGNKEPLPEDFFPSLYVENPEHQAVIVDELVHLRIALVRDEADKWCLGTPDHLADVEPSYGFAGDQLLMLGHLVCERPSPDPGDYAVGFPKEDAP